MVTAKTRKIENMKARFPLHGMAMAEGGGTELSHCSMVQ